MKTRPIVIAHRGASELAPENTLAAFERGWQAGADGVECDVRMTADCEIICFHDADTQRVAGESLLVANHSFEDLRKLDVGAWKGPVFLGTRIPLLSELLAKLPSEKQVFIEIKTGIEILPCLIEVIEQSAVDLNRITVLAFDQEVVRKLKKARPDLQAYWLIDVGSNWLGRSKLKIETVLETLAQLKADGLGLRCHSGIHRELVQNILEAGFRLNIWTVDEPMDARRYASFGVSSITSNRPAFILDALGSARD